MKNLKKFAALLLVGAMALLMLTACGGGGGGGGSVNNPEEQKVLNHISNQKGVHVTSDAQLREVAERHLREDLEGALQLGNHKFFTKVHVEGEKEEYMTITIRPPTRPMSTIERSERMRSDSESSKTCGSTCQTS